MLHHLNATQSKTSTRYLHSELWSIIFQLACPTSDVLAEALIQTPPFHLVLRLVCTLWYDIVQSTPQLWESVSLPKLCVENVDIKGRYLKLCLENSGGLPLTLSFRFDKGLREIGSFISPNVDATLELVTHRIRALRLSQPPRSWLDRLIPKMCQLAVIHISNPNSGIWPPRDETLSFPKAANINRIHIICPCLPHFCLDCVTSSVTHVDLFECPFDFSMEILLRCPNLIDFRCLFPMKASNVQNPRTTLTSPLVLHHLSTFTWSTSRNPIEDRISEWDTVLFESIHFPALKRFNWWPEDCFLTDDTPLALPLYRFPKSVTTLELNGRGFGNYPARLPVLNHFLPFTGVTQLRLRHCDYYFVGLAFSILSRKIDQCDFLFPELASIVLDYHVSEDPTQFWPEFLPEYGYGLVQMLRSRVGFMTKLTLIVEMAHLTRLWEDKVWDNLRKLKRDGLNLTIIECGHPITI